MIASHHNDVDSDNRLDEIVAAYFKAVEAGQSPDRRQLLADHPGLADKLGAFFADLDRFQRLAAPLRAVRHESDRSSAGATTNAPDGVRPVGANTSPGQDGAAATANETTVAVPEAVPGYEILGMLGRGGMGVVYKARHLKLKRLVALKMILAGGHADEDELARFRREAEAVAQLHHPNIVQIYEVGEHRGQPFCALELVAGGTLAARLGGVAQPPHDAAVLTRTLALAMDEAHRRHIIHRDLKPANILLATRRSEGPNDSATVEVSRIGLNELTPKIADFGLAKRLDEGSGHTCTGAVVGTPSYMSPEQAAGKKELSPAADVYALGAILYEMLCGRPPFAGPTPFDILVQVLHDDPVSPRALQPKVPRDLETICLKCLHKAPARRYGSAAALAEDLGRFLAGKPVMARPVTGAEQVLKWVRRRPTAAALVLACGVAALALVGTAVSWFINRALTAAHNETTAALEKSETYLYFNRIGLADRSWWGGNPGRTRELLAECPVERRGWEWHYLDRLAHSEAMALTGHSSELGSAVFSPDGTKLASGGDPEVKIWDAVSGRELMTLRHGYANQLFTLAFSPDGILLASAGADGPERPAPVRIWNLAGALDSGNPPSSPHGAGTPRADWGHSKLTFSPDGRRLAIACGMVLGKLAQVKVFAVEGGRELLTLPTTHEAALGVAYSPDGRRIASSSGSVSDSLDKSPGAVHIWDAESGKELRRLEGHKGHVYSVAFSGDGQFIASGGSDRLVKVWDATSYREVATLRGHTSTILRLTFRPDGKQLATADEQGAVKIWDPATGEELSTLRGHTAEVHSVAYHPDGHRLVSAGYDRVVRVWDATTSQEARTLRGHTGSVQGVAFSPDGTQVVTGSHDHTVLLWDLQGAGKPRLLSREKEGVWSVAFSPDGTKVAAGSGDWQKTTEQRQIAVWDLPSGTERFRRRAHVGVAQSVAFSPDGKRLVTEGGESFSPGTVKVWDAETGHELLSIPQPSGVRSVVFSPDGRLLAGAVNAVKVVKIWEAATGTELIGIPQGLEYPKAVVFSPDGRRLYAGGQDQTVRAWDTSTGELLATLRGHASDVRGLAVSADGKRLASASLDQTLKVWDVATGLEVLTLKGHSDYVHTVVFSPDGKLLASASEDNTVKIWDGTPRANDSNPNKVKR